MTFNVMTFNNPSSLVYWAAGWSFSESESSICLNLVSRSSGGDASVAITELLRGRRVNNCVLRENLA